MKNIFKNTLKNNKGYMLVEVILASAIAFGVAFVVIDLTLKVKDKNDDVYVKSIVSTDQNIITNGIMRILKSEGNSFSCDDLKIVGNTIKYKDDMINVVNDIAKIDVSGVTDWCRKGEGVINIRIPIKIIQIPDENFDVNINYKYNLPNVDFTFSVIDARTGVRPANLNYKIYIDSSGTWDLMDEGTTTPSDFTSALFSNSHYKITIVGSGRYTETSLEFDSNAGSPTHITVYVMKSGGDEIVVILDWKSPGRDLDSHTKIYNRNGGPMLGEVFYPEDKQKFYINGREVVSLDKDALVAVDSPETTTIKKTDNKFLFYVKNFSLVGNGLSQYDMSLSKAVVKIFDGAQLIKEIKVPATGTNPNYWKLFTYDGYTEEFDFCTSNCFYVGEPSL